MINEGLWEERAIERIKVVEGVISQIIQVVDWRSRVCLRSPFREIYSRCPLKSLECGLFRRTSRLYCY